MRKRIQEGLLVAGISAADSMAVVGGVALATNEQLPLSVRIVTNACLGVAAIAGTVVAYNTLPAQGLPEALDSIVE